MDYSDHSKRDEHTDDGSDPARLPGELPEIGCTLTTDRAERRTEWVEENLLPHLRSVEEREDGFTFAFERSEDAYAAVSEVAWKESQCCSWATFEVELPPGDAPIRWHERAEREDGTELFGDALEEMRKELELSTSD
jgi:hypothetical protein